MKYLMYLATLAWDIITIPIGLLIHILWGKKLRREGMCLITELRRESWPMNPFHGFWGGGWYSRWGGTTFGHFIMYSPEPSAHTRTHEHVHVHQYQATMLKSLFIGLIVLLLTGKLWLSYMLWASGYALYLSANWLTAGIRGGELYGDSIHEEHAYAVESVAYSTGDTTVWKNNREEYLQKYSKG